VRTVYCKNCQVSRGLCCEDCDLDIEAEMITFEYEIRNFFVMEREFDLGLGIKINNPIGMEMGVGAATWEWEGTGIKNPFPNTSTL